MFLRALAAFLVLPGVVAGLLPLLISAIDPWRGGVFVPGLVILGVGFFILLWCVRDFYVAGKGTLAPWNPPKKLVVVGLYRFVRNPMYIGVLLIIAGWAQWRLSPALGVYGLLLAISFHLRVTRNEEPWLVLTFGSDWEHYAARVNRWLPRLTPWRQHG